MSGSGLSILILYWGRAMQQGGQSHRGVWTNNTITQSLRFRIYIHTIHTKTGRFGGRGNGNV